MPYDPAAIEPRWQAFWEANHTFRSDIDASKPKFYALDMFPYPSGAGLHVGHPEGYTATDIVSRYKRMRGFNVLHPMGWDVFGLPAERAAVREGQHPADITQRNTDNFRRQIKRLGFSYDWDREINTSAPDYYRWTQWIFLRLHEMGLAYQAEVPVNWCPALGTVLANEEVSPEGTYKETGDPVEKRLMKQWMLKITQYAQRLLDDLEDVDWPEPVKKMQRDWIGRSEGAEIRFAIEGQDGEFTVFTTRPDTLFGATYCVLAPEHPLVSQITTKDQKETVDAYVHQASMRSERDRRAGEAKEKTGAFTGAYAVNPVNGEKMPIWIADYVLASYGTGAIMAVPGHDERDFEFAKAFDLPIRMVVQAKDGSLKEPLEAAYCEPGIAVNSSEYDGLTTEEFKQRIIRDLEAKGVAEARIQYALRDWLFSRQRYWGEPFPLVTLEDGTVVPLPDDALPVELPHVDAFKPTEDGRPPLARAEEWLHTTAPGSGAPAIRETNTMPQWAGSCWYYLRFCDPKNEALPFSQEAEQYWMPVDLYIGGTEHAVLHLLYARFWHKVLYDLKLVHTKEPFQKLYNQGMILAYSYRDRNRKPYHQDDVEEKNGQFVTKTGTPVTQQIEKMSKSVLNVVNPDDVIDEYGADSMRLYEMFLGPLDATKPWQTSGIEGVHRFLHRSWRLFFDEGEEGQEDPISAAVQDVAPDAETRKLLHKTIAAVTDDVDNLAFNTAISCMMEFVNAMTGTDVRPKSVLEDFLKLLSPFAPHFAEEVWHRLGHTDTMSYVAWPSFDPELLVENTITLPISVQGKVRARIEIHKDAAEDEIKTLALAEPAIVKHLDGKEPRRVIYVPGRMVNIVP
ncbi:MAG: leucine--tRNA ligase [Planctomycetota bacterium]